MVKLRIVIVESWISCALWSSTDDDGKPLDDSFDVDDVSRETRRAAERGFAFLEVDYIAAGSDDAPVHLYALVGNPVARGSPKFRALSTFHEHIFNSLRSQQWGKARELIEQCRRLSGASQALYDLHLARIRYFEANPPGPNWDGAFRPILK